MKRVFDFLVELKNNNNREWFNAHKEQYLEVQAIFNEFVEKLIERIARWDSDIKESALTIKDCTYRIYKDIRFSKDKLPYKTHMGGYICKGGKKSQYAGYYFHIEPAGNDPTDGFLSGSLLAVGLYRPEPKIVKSIRDEIYVNGGTFIAAAKNAKGFECDGHALKKVPAEFADINPEWSEWVKQKEFGLYMNLKEKYLFGDIDKLLDYAEKKFKSCYEYNRLINKAVDYALEEL